MDLTVEFQQLPQYSEKHNAPTHLNNISSSCFGQGALAMAFDLAAFQLSMIATVKKSVNHARTVASMCEMGWEQQQEEVCLQSNSTV